MAGQSGIRHRDSFGRGHGGAGGRERREAYRAVRGGAVEFTCRVESANAEVGNRLLVSEPI